MMGKFGDKFGAISAQIVPTGAGRNHAKSIPSVESGGMALQRDQALERASTAEAEVARLNALLADAKAQGGALDVDLAALDEVPGRRRSLTPEAFGELRENLRQHELVTPITVRPLPSGRFEIISGHNRVAVYRELGRETIKAWPAEADDSKTDELAFYANLLHPDLSALEKFQGLKRIRMQYPEITISGLAERTGLSKSVVGELMTMDSLPEEALNELAKNPGAMGARALSQMAAIAKEGRAEQVVSAIRMAVNEGTEQQEAVRLAASKPKATPQARPEPMVFRAGRKNYCSMIGARKTLRLEFQSEEERAETEEALKEFLEQRAKQKAK